MKTLHLIFILTTVISTTELLAQTPYPQPAQPAPNQYAQPLPNDANMQKRKKRKKKKPDNTTAGQREKKSLGIGVGLANLYGGIYGGRGEVSLNLSRRWQLVFYGMYGAYSDTDTTLISPTDEELANNQDDKSFRTSIDVTLAGGGLDMRFFLGNSFSFGLGGGMRSMNFDMTATSIWTDEVIVGMYGQNNSIFMSFDVANQWIFNSGFYLKGIWIGYTNTLSSTKSASTNGELATPENGQVFLDTANRLVDTGSSNQVYFKFMLGVFF